MPKPFPLTVVVEELALGQVLHKLEKMPGVLNVDFRQSAKPNGAKRPTKSRATYKGGQTGHDLLTGLIAKQPLTTAEAKEAFVKQGRNPNSYAAAIYRSSQNEWVKRNAAGQWVVTAAGKKRLAELARGE